jgi:3-hydroxybutyryl-CoA dehydrogenase
MALAHGIRTLGVLGAGQMGELLPFDSYSQDNPINLFASSGTGIAFVSALRAKVPVLLHDRSPTQLTSGLALIDKTLKKDIAKGKITGEDAKDAMDRITVVGPEVGLKGLRDVDMVVEVGSSAHFCIE